MINIPVVFSVLLLVASVVFLQRSRRAGASEKVLGRLSSDFISTDKINFGAVQRELVRTGIHLDFWRVMLLVGIWLVLLVIVLWSAGVLAFIVTAIASVVLLRFYLLVRLRRRLQRMIVQLPQLLDHIIRSLKSGRTLGDGFLLAIDNCQQPLHGALLRTRKRIQRGMPLSDAVDDFAALYEQEEFHILALSMSVNQRYGGNASEVLENLIRLIRDRDQASRQLRAMTGETRMSALVLGGLPIAMAGYLFLSSPDLLLGMWEQTSGQLVLLFAFALQLIGSFFALAYDEEYLSMNALILSSLLLLTAATLLFSLVIRRYVAIRNVVGRLGGQDQSNVLDTFSNSVVSANTKLFDSEVIQLLNQLGWRKARHRMAFFALQIGLPLILALLVLMLQSVGAESSDSDDSMFWLMLLLVLGIGYLIPKRILVKSAKARQQRLAVEVSTMIPLLRMLFEVGMTVEQSLRVLVNSGEKILPELTIELQHILLRVDAGLELGEELRHTAFMMQVDELTDTFTILEQLIHQGGGGMSSLLSLKELIDDRRMTTLQERVSKMSAKMSIVMMVFLFPALLIILAGPGFIAIIQALGDMG